MTKQKRTKRGPTTRFYVLHQPMSTAPWVVVYAGGGTDSFEKKGSAIQEAVRAAKEEHKATRRTCQLFIQGKDGRWDDERTYGHDPNPPKG